MKLMFGIKKVKSGDPRLDLLNRIAVAGSMEKQLADVIGSLADKLDEAAHDKKKMRKLIKEFNRSRIEFVDAIVENTPIVEKPWYFTRGKP